MKRRGICLLLLLLFFVGFEVQAVSHSAKSAILVDFDSGRVLYEDNADEKRLIASITKLMTALVAVESAPDISETVKIKAEWTGAEGSSLYLEAGQSWRLETLLYGLLLHSGNDAAIAIAGHCAGDVETFVEWMNQRAADLGMADTHFQNPNGLNHEAHYSTARDMAKLAAACMENEVIAKIVATKSISLEGRSFANHNKLLWQYEGCVGMKTGYTDLAGRTLISSARRDGQTLIAVTLSDPDDWEDHAALLDYGFSQYPGRQFFEAGESVSWQRVEGSLLRSVPVYIKDSLSYPLTEDEDYSVTVLLPGSVAAPVYKGSIAGLVTVFVSGEVVCQSYLLYGAEAERHVIAQNPSIQRLLSVWRGKEYGNLKAVFSGF